MILRFQSILGYYCYLSFVKIIVFFLTLLLTLSSWAQMSSEEKSYIDSLKKEVDQTKNDTIRINALFAWDDVIWRYQPEVDRKLNERIQKICSQNLKNKKLSERERLFYKTKYAKALNNLGTLLYTTGNYSKAISHFAQSLKIKEEIGDLSGAGASLNNIGNIYLEQGNNSKAREYYIRSRDIFKKLKDDGSLSAALGNLGLISVNQGDYSKAIEYQEESLEIRRKLNDKSGIAVCLSNLGQVYNALGEYDKAIEFFQKGKELYEELGDKYGIAQSLNDFGNAYLKQKKYKEALEVSIKAASVAKERDALQFQRDAYNIMYQCNEKLGDQEGAFKNYKRFIELSDSLETEENQREIIKQQFKYEYEVQAAEASVARDKERKIDKIRFEKKNQQLIFLLIGLVLIIVFSIFIFNRFRITRAQKALIEQQKLVVESVNKSLGEKNQEILDSINYAKRIQNAILPPKSSMTEHLKDHFVFYKPKDIVAGDFYWLEKKGDTLLFAVADCTGHGVPGAMVSVVCNNGLNRSVREYSLTNPGEILNKTREIVLQEFEKSDDDVKDGMDIALCALKGSTLHYSGANNPLWIIRNNELIEFKADKQPIGKSTTELPYTTHTFELQSGDAVYLFSDGFADQFGGVNSKKFMLKNFKDHLILINELPMTEQITRISAEFDSWKKDLEQVDDVCVLGVRIQ